MKINLNWDSDTVNATTLGSVTNLTAFETQIKNAAALFEKTYSDNITINITIKYADIGATTLGTSSQSLFTLPYDTAKQKLFLDWTSADDRLAVGATDTATHPDNLYFTRA